MPRPKRSKVAPSDPITRVATTVLTAEPTSEMSSHSSSERVTTNSDDSEGLISKSKTEVNRPVVAPQEATMSGALAPEDLAGGRLKPIRGRKRAALSRIAREGDHAKAIAALEARRNAALAKEKAEGEQREFADEGVILGTQDDTTNVGVAMPEPRSEAAKAAVGEVGNVAMTAKPSRPMTAVGSQRRESSILADFKRRPRQPSLLAMVSAQHQQDQAEESNSDDSLNDFQPDGESTPFMISKSQLPEPKSTPSARTSSQQLSSGSRKRKLAAIEPEIQVPASQPSPSHASSPPAGPASELSRFDIPADENAAEPQLPVIQSTQLSSQLGNSTLAPPRSSSPPPTPQPQARSTRPKPTANKSHSRNLLKPKAQPTRTQPSRALSPPRSPQSSTSSHPSPVRPAKSKPLKPLTTASLQNLLPRRRVRAKATEFDIPSSSDIEASSDQDELSFHRAPKVRGTGNFRRKLPGVKVPPVVKNKKGRVSATYGRKAAVQIDTAGEGSEDHGDEGEISPVKGRTKGGATYGRDGAAVKGEMRRLAQKFREVDEWALEIEDVTPHSGSSQMVDAR